jgi:phasin family protein
MQNFDTKQITEQFESMFVGPARSYAALTVGYTDMLINAQLDAGKAYADIGLAQLRSLINVKDAEGLKSYMEDQQKVAKDMSDRMKNDAETVVSLQKDFVQHSQKLTEDTVKQATDSATKVAI